jgi:phosphate transport system substrate-binding protein
MTAIAVALLGSFSAAAQGNPAADVLHIEVSESGREIVTGFLPAVTRISGLSTTPVVKYSSALGVLRDFCQGVGGSSPDIVLTTRRLPSSLANECTKNGVEHMVQVELGRSALVLAVRGGSGLGKLTARDVYLALARDVPDQEEFRRNTAIRWSDIDHALPPQDIRFQLPPRDDIGRSIFNGLILEGGCRREPLVKLIFTAEQRSARCLTTRVDRVREIPHDQAVQALLEAPEGTVGVLPYPDYMEANGKLTALALDGVTPTDETILNGTYDYTSFYWMYAKRGQARRGRAPAIDKAADRVIALALTDPVIGPGGIMDKAGLIPLGAEDRIAQRAVFAVRSSSYNMWPVVTWVSDTAGAARSLVDLLLGESGAKEAKGDQDFTSLMDLAGYKTQEFQTSVGLFPGAGMTFGIVREMSEADQTYLERKLIQDAHNRPGALPGFQRKIVRSILDVSEDEGYEISQVVIEILPLPSVKLVVSPTDAPISQETTSILRAIERLSDRLSEISQ